MLACMHEPASTLNAHRIYLNSICQPVPSAIVGHLWASFLVRADRCPVSPPPPPPPYCFKKEAALCVSGGGSGPTATQNNDLGKRGSVLTHADSSRLQTVSLFYSFLPLSLPPPPFAGRKYSVFSHETSTSDTNVFILKDVLEPDIAPRLQHCSRIKKQAKNRG